MRHRTEPSSSEKQAGKGGDGKKYPSVRPIGMVPWQIALENNDGTRSEEGWNGGKQFRSRERGKHLHNRQGAKTLGYLVVDIVRSRTFIPNYVIYISIFMEERDGLRIQRQIRDSCVSGWKSECAGC